MSPFLSLFIQGLGNLCQGHLMYGRGAVSLQSDSPPTDSPFHSCPSPSPPHNCMVHQTVGAFCSGLLQLGDTPTSVLIPQPSVQSLSHVRLFATPRTAAHQASLSITISQSLLKLMSIESVMQSNHLILCCPLLLLPSIFPRIGLFSNESVLCIRWPTYWSFSFSISPSNEYSGLISFRIDWFHLLQWVPILWRK